MIIFEILLTSKGGGRCGWINHWGLTSCQNKVNSGRFRQDVSKLRSYIKTNRISLFKLCKDTLWLELNQVQTRNFLSYIFKIYTFITFSIYKNANWNLIDDTTSRVFIYIFSHVHSPVSRHKWQFFNLTWHTSKYV